MPPRAKRPRAKVSPPREPPRTSPPAPVVCIGASAGGLEAFTQLLRALPADTGMAFVLVQHLDPRHQSMLTSLLAKATSMPIRQVEEGMRVEPDHVYVIPPNASMAIEGGVLRLIPRAESRGRHMPVDFFMRTLAADQQGRAIGVILSGTASDGALGMAAIKAEGGITFAQDQHTAKFDGMPRAAVAAGCVDFILPPDGIARELVRIGRHPYLIEPEQPVPVEPAPGHDTEIGGIFQLLRAVTGVDFTHYKSPTIRRRISRRMILHKIDSLAMYLTYLRDHPDEVSALYNDILINVTSFFRDPEAFKALKTRVFPHLVDNRPPDSPLRLWVPGCATGEEAYSLAIAILEFLGDRASSTPLQIFATDISEPAIEKARAGIYPENIALDVSPERLRRFFVRVDGGHQIAKSVRDMCIFARQNLVRDPPFSKLDLISCRNLLIYLGPTLQKKVMTVFHYALKPSRFLLLGSSETMSAHSDLFVLADRKHKIYTRRATPTRMHIEVGFGEYHVERPLETARKAAADAAQDSHDVQKEADRLVLDRFAPSGVIINDHLEILQFRGRTSLFLEPAPGQATFSLLKMAREGLLFDLRTSIFKARKENGPVRKEALQVRANGQVVTFNLEVVPLHGIPASQRCFLVLFQQVASAPARPAPAAKPRAGRQEEARETSRLQHELAATKDNLQSIIEEQEATNEELKSANEEILSSNEELQSTNEELETAKEELQSSNEELTTVNEELQNRNLELSQANNDLNNLLASVKIPVLMLGNDLRIRRFTPAAEKLLNLIPTDLGRPITDIQPNITVPHLEQLVLDVIESVSPRELEAQDHEGRWYSLQMRPYKTSENRIDGVVLALIDIDAPKRAQAELERRVQEREVGRA
jgi:two-component system CheB/CheR fusion protein